MTQLLQQATMLQLPVTFPNSGPDMIAFHIQRS
jgi:hypothetical protein